MEEIQIIRKKLIVPEPKELWNVDKKEQREIVRKTKQFWAEFRAAFGFGIPANVSSMVFGSEPTSNQKFGKSLKDGILIYGLSLAQSNLSGINVCHWSTPECRANCVGKNGNNGFPATMQAKIAKTKFLFEHPEEAGILLADFWMKAENKATHGVDVGGRMNTYSDINWIEVAPWIFNRFQVVNYFDYTKDWSRTSPFSNYHLTYSVGEKTTDDQIINKLENGQNVAIVFSSWSKLPTEYMGYQVFNGDETDARWLDPKGIIVGLKRKGSMKASSPMVRNF